MKKSLIKLGLSALLSLVLVAPFAAAQTGTVALPTINSNVGTNNQAFVGKILGFIQFVGVAIALGMLIIIGIQYVAAPAEKKGQIKETAIGYLFGAICIFAAVGILSGIQSMVGSLNNAN